MSTATMSDRKLHANRSNAAHSTGPRSDAGKARAAQNAVRHGFFSQQLLLDDEEQELYDELREGMLRQLAPRTALEGIQVERIVDATWRMRRLREAETAYLTEHPGPLAILDAEMLRLQTYDNRLQSRIDRALAELRRMKSDPLPRDSAPRQRMLRNEPTPPAECPQVPEESGDRPLASPPGFALDAADLEAERLVAEILRNEPTTRPRDKLRQATRSVVDALLPPVGAVMGS